MQSEFPEQDQRAAVCMTQWRKKSKKNEFRHHHFTVLESRADLIREETLNDRKYIVAPCTPIVEGVHNGEFISYEEITIFPEMWNGRPLPIDHPMDENNEPSTANSPKVMQESVIGILFNVVAREDIRGISGEIWIDVEKAAEVAGGDEVLRKLQAGENLEVSTGYFTLIDNAAGEWRNSKNGQVEKFTSSQFQIRPDHLALLPFDLGACSWKDGCGAPRINSKSEVDSDMPLKSDSTICERKTEIVAKPEKDLTVNGKHLAKALSGAIAANADADGSTDSIINRLAVAADIKVDKIKDLLAGKIDFAPRRWLGIFAAVLDMDPWDVYAASSDDNANIRYSTNEKKVETPGDALTTVHNEQDKATECQKSLSQKVLEILRSLGITKVPEKTEVKEDMKQMNTNAEAKKAKVDALIASDKNKFTETHREWLTGLSDDQLDAFDIPESQTATAAAANAEVKKDDLKPEIKPEVKADAAKPEEKQVVLSKEQLLQILGVTDDDLKAAKSVSDEKKAARNAKIAEILAVENCKFTKAELETFSDCILDKTLEALTPASPFRVVAGGRQQQAKDQVPVAPSILLAKPATKEAK